MFNKIETAQTPQIEEDITTRSLILKFSQHNLSTQFRNNIRTVFGCYYVWTVESTIDNAIEELIEDLVGKWEFFKF